VYSSWTLQKLRPGRAVGRGWLVHLDVALRRLSRSSWPARTCLLPTASILREESYLRRSRLTPGLSAEHNIEAVKLHPSADVQLHCPTNRTIDDAIAMNHAGLVVSYCYRLAMKRSLAKLAAVWEETAGAMSRAFPMLGTSITLFRMGRDAEIMPWDYDIDIGMMFPQHFKTDLFMDRLRLAGSSWRAPTRGRTTSTGSSRIPCTGARSPSTSSSTPRA